MGTQCGVFAVLCVRYSVGNSVSNNVVILYGYYNVYYSNISNSIIVII